MPKLLVVHRTEWKDISSNYGTILKVHNITVELYPLKDGLDPFSDDTDLCCVGLRPKQAVEVQRQLCLKTEPRKLKILRGAKATELRSWIAGAPSTVVTEANPPEDDRPWPGYKAHIISRKAECPRLLLSRNALNRADKVVGREDLYGKHFIRFIREAMDALIFVARSSSPVDLQETLLDRSNLDYAPSGGDFTAKYKNPITGRLTETKRHLKPATERKGFYSSEQKPRLYFDTFTDPATGEPWVVLLYFGPHPNENTDDMFIISDTPAFFGTSL